ncbi:hypothetical protein SUGI_1490160 [Cryptomeria japonica]|uniref:Uncharacterized protein n=1 Tax=Cryptomeria japonica TaxID=3369 RepID=A0AAD3NRP5_CRYJA|nr:hypothetical protein SUGI_1412800 [Cryptomeria japonica]GLJ59053.1 hypothetical protein SUGI_1490160 [Cryptomeria japonica]
MASSRDFMPSPAPSQDIDLDLGWSDVFTILADYLTIGFYGLFSFLIMLDVWRAITKRATWLPGKAFTLTGVTVQIIVWWTSVSHIVNECKKDVEEDELAFFHQIVLSGKVAVCVFIGYLLPGMAASSVTTFLALGISICAQIASELVLFQKQQDYSIIFDKPQDYKNWKTWAEAANLILLICIIVLGSISVCTMLGSQTFHGLMKQRTHAIFSLAHVDEFELSNERTMAVSWNDFENEVLSSWLVARVCRADYVISSKLCGLLSEVIIGTFIYWLRKLMRRGHPVAEPEKCQNILKLICMPGEDPSDLWEANEMSFNKLKSLMQEGCKKGGTSDKINSIFSLYSLQWAEDGKRLLNMLEAEAFPSVMKYFPSVEKRCVRLTVVSLITIFSQLHKAESAPLGNVLNACQEVWDLLSFADECDIDLQANEISLSDDLSKDKDQVGMAAEREFYKLQKVYKKLDSGSEECVINVVDAPNILQELLRNCEVLLKKESLIGGEEEVAILSDSKDWMQIAPKYNLYKLCKLMLEKDIEDLTAWTEVSLKNVIAFAVTRLPNMLVKQCKKWAEEFEEDKFWEAIELAGKCRGMIAAWTKEGMDVQN